MGLAPWAWVLAGGLILLGLMPGPGDMSLAAWDEAGAGSAWLALILALADLAPALPLVLALMALVGGRLTWALALGLILASAPPLALLLTLGAAYGSGGGSGIILFKGAALTLGVWGMVLHLAGRAVWGRLALAPAVTVALWSLATPLAVAASATGVAGGAPYCIAGHAPERPILSWAELRGARFHTDRSGFKDTSAWYLHGVMLVQREGGVEAWNGSPRALRFDLLARPGDLLVSPFGTCQPVPGFLGRLSLF